MYVNIIFGDAPIYLGMFIYLAKESWALWRDKYGNMHYWKRKQINSCNIVRQSSIERFKTISGHNSMAEMRRALFKYENMEETSIEIIVLQLGGSIKWDCMWKQGRLGMEPVIVITKCIH